MAHGSSRSGFQGLLEESPLKYLKGHLRSRPAGKLPRTDGGRDTPLSWYFIKQPKASGSRCPSYCLCFLCLVVVNFLA